MCITNRGCNRVAYLSAVPKSLSQGLHRSSTASTAPTAQVKFRLGASSASGESPQTSRLQPKQQAIASYETAWKFRSSVEPLLGVAVVITLDTQFLKSVLICRLLADFTGSEPPPPGAGQTAHTTGEEPGKASTTLAFMLRRHGFDSVHSLSSAFSSRLTRHHEP